MVSRLIALSLSLVSVSSNVAVSAASSPPLRKRASSQAGISSSASSEAIPDIVNTRSLQESSKDIPDIVDKRSLQENETVVSTVQIPTNCLNLLAASANENQKLKKENYFVFTDGMSNGWYTLNNMTEYNDLPFTNKFGFVTLACQCSAFGGRSNCCQGDRAKLDVAGIDDPASMPTEMQLYVNDICSTTEQSVGDNKLPPSGELPTTSRPTTSVPPTKSPAPTLGPSVSNRPTHSPSNIPSLSTIPTIPVPSVDPVLGNGGEGRDNDSDDFLLGLSFGEWTGIAIASAFVITWIMHLYVNRDKGRQEAPVTRDLALLDQDDRNKTDMLMITDGGGGGTPALTQSPDAAETVATSTSGTSSRSNGLGSARSSTPRSAQSDDPGSDRGNFASERQSSAYKANHPYLPFDEEDLQRISSSDDEDNVFTDDGIEAGVPVNSSRSAAASPAASILKSRRYPERSPASSAASARSLDQAIESGNWEAVAASAANIVKQNEHGS